MRYSFTCYGHENVVARHKTTLEFTKDKELSLKGDCIVGVKADFSLLQLKKFIKTVGNNRKITIIIETINKDSKNNNTMKNNDNEKLINNKKIKINENKIINNDYNRKLISNENNKMINNEKNNNLKENIVENKIIEKINAEINPDFNSDKEIVIRKSDFVDERTFAINADKAAFELNMDLIGFLKRKKGKIMVIVENKS